MAKRTATTELNHDNWDREYDAEEAGTFTKASEDVMKKRVFKVARRRNPISQEEGEGKVNAFGSFSGFGKDQPASTKNTFDFLKKISDTPKTNGSTTVSTSTPSSVSNKKDNDSDAFWIKLKSLSDNVNDYIKKNIKNIPSISQEPAIKNFEKYMEEIDKIYNSLENKKSTTATFSFGSNAFAKKTNGLASSDENDKTFDEYYGKLKGLNESVSDWINKHVCDNPLISLEPIMEDYQKYMADLDKLHADLSAKKTQPEPIKFGIPSAPTTAAATPPKFSFGSSASSPQFAPSSTTTTPTVSASGFSFGFTATSSSSASTSGISSSSSAPTFSFGSAPNGQFSFTSTVVKPADEAPKTEGDDDEDQPPKVEFTPVVEEGHIYTIRCKVFVKKGDSYGDRGVGNLYLKPVPDSDKVQLIVRADTNLGNLICNFILSSGIPIQRMGKKDVMLVCLPTPETKPPPVPVLLRVKTPEEADDLLKVLKDNQK